MPEKGWIIHSCYGNSFLIKCDLFVFHNFCFAGFVVTLPFEVSKSKKVIFREEGAAMLLHALNFTSTHRHMTAESVCLDCRKVVLSWYNVGVCEQFCLFFFYLQVYFYKFVFHN